MDETASPEDEDDLEAEPNWLERIDYYMRPREAGRIALVYGGADTRLRKLALSLLQRAPDLHVVWRAPQIIDIPERALVLFPVRESDAEWLNGARPIFAQRALRVVLWSDRATVGRLLVRAPDFMHWISHTTVAPKGLPAFAVAGLRGALRARARGVAWFGKHLAETFAEALPGRTMRRVSAVGTSLERARDVRDCGPAWVVWTEVDADERVTLAERALAIAHRRARAILADPCSTPDGFWPLHAGTMPFAEACEHLSKAGAQGAGRLAALLDLEPEAVHLAADLLVAGVPEHVLEPLLIRAEDPGAAMGLAAVERRRVDVRDRAAPKKFSAPVWRALGRAADGPAPVPTADRGTRAERRLAAMATQPVLRLDRLSRPVRRQIVQTDSPDIPRIRSAETQQPDASGLGQQPRRAIELLLREATSLHWQGRYAELRRAAIAAREAAMYLGDLTLEVRAARLEGDAHRLLGRSAEAMAAYLWILGIVEDPSRPLDFSDEDLLFDVASTYAAWVESAMEVPSIGVDRIVAVLDAGERFLRSEGRPSWRASLLQLRARLMEQSGRLDEAIRVAEEGLALALRMGLAPGGGPSSHRWALGHLLRRTGRGEEARVLYEAVLADSSAHPGDQLAALRGLQACALSSGDAAAARRFAEEAVRVAEPMGDAASSRALISLVDACLADGDIVGARAAAERALRHATRIGAASTLFSVYIRLTLVAIEEGDLDRASTLVAQAQPHADALDEARGHRRRRDALEDLRGRVARAQGSSRADGSSEAESTASGAAQGFSDPD